MQMVGEKLVTHWRADGLFIRPGASEAHIRAFEKKYQVVMPPDLRAYFLCVDGMTMVLSDGEDKEGFCFWPLSRVKSATEELVRLEGLPPYNDQAMRDYFVFADYLQWSWAYAIYLLSGASPQNPVVLIGKEHPIKIADSFTSFVDLYLIDSPKLYGSS
jgi:hypothetical protein